MRHRESFILGVPRIPVKLTTAVGTKNTGLARKSQPRRWMLSSSRSPV
jgi:hypothetical protein